MTNPTNVIPVERGAADTIPVKSYFERLIMEQDRLRQTELAGLRTEIVTRLDAADRAVVIQLDAKEKALNLKSAEMERRLELLNGEAGRLAKVLAESVPREVWEQSQKALNEWKVGVDKTLNTTAGKSAQTIYIVGIILVLLQIGLKFFIK